MAPEVLHMREERLAYPWALDVFRCTPLRHILAEKRYVRCQVPGDVCLLLQAVHSWLQCDLAVRTSEGFVPSSFGVLLHEAVSGQRPCAQQLMEPLRCAAARLSCRRTGSCEAFPSAMEAKNLCYETRVLKGTISASVAGVSLSMQALHQAKKVGMLNEACGGRDNGVMHRHIQSSTMQAHACAPAALETWSWPGAHGAGGCMHGVANPWLLQVLVSPSICCAGCRRTARRVWQTCGRRALPRTRACGPARPMWRRSSDACSPCRGRRRRRKHQTHPLPPARFPTYRRPQSGARALHAPAWTGLAMPRRAAQLL